MKRGQGLPLSFIVIAAISALVLILVVAFTIGGLGGFFKQMVAPAPEELGTVQASCQSFCNGLVAIATAEQFKGSAYCKKTFAIDLDRNGKVNTTGEVGLKCPAIGVECTKQIGNTVLTGANCSAVASQPSPVCPAACLNGCGADGVTCKPYCSRIMQQLCARLREVCIEDNGGGNCRRR